MSVRKGFIGGISVHSIYKGEVLIPLVYSWKAIRNFERKVDVKKGA